MRKSLAAIERDLAALRPRVYALQSKQADSVDRSRFTGMPVAASVNCPRGSAGFIRGRDRANGRRRVTGRSSCSWRAVGSERP